MIAMGVAESDRHLLPVILGLLEGDVEIVFVVVENGLDLKTGFSIPGIEEDVEVFVAAGPHE